MGRADVLHQATPEIEKRQQPVQMLAPAGQRALPQLLQQEHEDRFDGHVAPAPARVADVRVERLNG